jgi:hypothetical protein
MYLIFVVVVGLECSNNPETYASSSAAAAAGRVCHAGHVRGVGTDKTGYTGPQVVGWSVRLTSPP